MRLHTRATAIVLAAALASLLAASSDWATFPGRNGDISFNRFTDHDPDFALDLLSINPDGGDLAQLTTFGLNTVSEYSDHSPDGRRIAYGKGGIYITSVASLDQIGDPQLVCADCGRPCGFSPDGSKLIFISNREGTDPRRDLNVFLADWR